jgi:putative endonuclease
MKPAAQSAAELGRQAENAVADYLGDMGYQVLSRNYQVARLGELDLVAWKDSRLYVVEVKARSRAAAFGGLPATVTRGKIRRLRQTAWCYLKENHLMNCDVSFLAALVQINANGSIESIETILMEGL